jgi:hypothetical protein
MDFNIIPNIDNNLDSPISNIEFVGNDIYACGTFSFGNTISTNGLQISYYNPESGEYKCIGYIKQRTNSDGIESPIDSSINCIIKKGNNIYVGGYFNNITNISGEYILVNSLAVYNLETNLWKPVDIGVINPIDRLQNNIKINNINVRNNGNIIVSGSFKRIGQKNFSHNINNIAIWTGSKWKSVGNGISGNELYIKNLIATPNLFFAVTEYKNSNNQIENSISIYNTIDDTWSQIEGLNENSIIETLCLDIDTNTLYIGGKFVTSTQITNIAKYNINTNTWSSLPNNQNSSITNGAVINIITKAKEFFYIIATESNNILSMSRFNSLTNLWNNITIPLTLKKNIQIKTCSIVNDVLYLGGNFSLNNGYNNIMKYKNGQFSTVNNGVNSTINSSYSSEIDKIVYIVGNFNQVYGNMMNSIAKFNSLRGRWEPFGTFKSNGVGKITGEENWGTINNFKIDGKYIYVVGSFTYLYDSTGKVLCNNVARFDTENKIWEPLANGISNELTCIEIDKNYIYVGGFFSEVNGLDGYNSLARFNRNLKIWESMDNGVTLLDGTSGFVKCLKFDDSNNLYVGGTFTFCGTIQSKGIAKWSSNLNTWSGLDGGLDIDKYAPPIMDDIQLSDVIILQILIDETYVYVCGYFNLAGNDKIQVLGIVRWERNTGKWVPLTAGVNSYVTSMDFDSDGNLFITGLFSNISTDEYLSIIALWDKQKSKLKTVHIDNFNNLGSNKLLKFNTYTKKLYICSDSSNINNQNSNYCLVYNTVTKTVSENLLPPYFSVNTNGSNNASGSFKNPIKVINEAVKRSTTKNVVYINRNVFDKSVKDQTHTENYITYVLKNTNDTPNMSLNDIFNNSITLNMPQNNRKHLFGIVYKSDDLIGPTIIDSISKFTYKTIVTYLYGLYDNEGNNINGNVIHFNANVPDYMKYVESINDGNGTYVALFTKNILAPFDDTMIQVNVRNNAGDIDYDYNTTNFRVMTLSTKNTAISHGEPHVLPFFPENGKRIYDLPDRNINACFRLLDYRTSGNESLIINCSTRKLTLDDFPEFLYSGMNKVNKHTIPWLDKFTYYDSIFIKYKASTFKFEIENTRLYVNDKANIFDYNESIGKYITPAGKYKETGTCKNCIINIKLPTGEFIELKIYVDLNIDDRSSIIIGNTNFTVNLESSKSKFRGCLYKQSDCITITNLHDCSNIYGLKSKDEIDFKLKQLNKIKNIRNMHH